MDEINGPNSVSKLESLGHRVDKPKDLGCGSKDRGKMAKRKRDEFFNVSNVLHASPNA